ncbi:hypothetical protein [Hoeflea poritis]|uniref:Uncharacterized protein n=1 Tax=Hoeflea poritis TaxID=2993659 RepID=A0ABT4VPA2_9HYPH|nr:hypothetical protein [Hoeflea poritis]MDA4845970.1 hypothetical protein [Hoeflea poritis]
MSEFQNIHDAHGELVHAVADVTKPGAQPIPITLVSVTDEINGQMVVFDGQKFEARTIVHRLRLAADFIEKQL